MITWDTNIINTNVAITKNTNAVDLAADAIISLMVVAVTTVVVDATALATYLEDVAVTALVVAAVIL
ncbi:hypothetical protein [Clostridium botulinum]|uniref:Membrane protein n=1 Tax=Clostridium botulinum (strain Hall / ATCC 3502 / NCTC 13319 / Type A) TaxID=441771 RepID=A5HZA1_CLOBH|nr:hypothetical protein [Clostridium botulinum]EPS49261.1 hypothetical protein CFSAN002369_12505 [Clostridium botulinum CFSAN002369]EPS50100.1 hypothetical protein CFSAN002367_12987 [Clostridium botulinum CFSAN002367]CAL82110.1 putative membrane protein [Clostridium botulinum A str. ATCC 3502]MBY6910038.1 hypothetical protein [Clostridium botulinum]MCJ8171067.1 hypothetical protein [Clostridium botulinum]